MTMPRDASSPPGILARYTPDSRRWRRLVAGFAALGSPLALYAAFAVASGVKSGMVYNLFIFLFGILALVLPAIAAVALLAPNSGLTQKDSFHRKDPVEVLKRRYAAGEINHEEFDYHLDTLLEMSEDSLDRREGTPSSDRPIHEEDVEPAGM